MSRDKTCPFCAEDVRVEAIKCKHCGSFLGDRRSPSEWYRSSTDRAVAGVCGGLALQFGLPTTLVRLAFVLMTIFFGGVGLIIYVVLWVIMPQDEWIDEVERTTQDLRGP